ncbi:MAG: hypothetical protein ACI8WB_002853 [Phenylobacterium sp.]|jgi:hypothetical protein
MVKMTKKKKPAQPVIGLTGISEIELTNNLFTDVRTLITYDNKQRLYPA